MNMHWVPEELFLPRHKAVNMLAPPSWKFILALVAMKHGVMQRDILGDSRFKEHVAARHEAMVCVYQHTKLGMIQVGKRFNRDHSIVCHAMDKFGAKGKLVQFPAKPPKPPKAIKNYRHKRRGPGGRFLAKGAPDPLSPTVLRSQQLRAAILEGYAAGESTVAIAERVGSTSASVRVVAHKMGVKHPRMGNVLPEGLRTPEMVSDYLVLRSKKFRRAEALQVLGVSR